jgi:hypothetical protein
MRALRQSSGRATQPADITLADLDALRDELSELKAENAALKAQVAALTARLALVLAPPSDEITLSRRELAAIPSYASGVPPDFVPVQGGQRGVYLFHKGGKRSWQEDGYRVD